MFDKNLTNFSRNYKIGISWFIFSLIVSSFNDVIAKYLSFYLPPLEISFYRFLFSTVSLLPFVLYNGILSIKTSRFTFHFIRGLFLALAIFLWINGLKSSQVIMATIISFTIPMFILILAPIILKESISLKLWIVTFVGIIGILITITPNTVNFTIDSCPFVIAAILFASLDIINKKYVIQETMLSMLFYSSLFTTIFLFLPLNFNLVTPQIIDLIFLIFLGVNSNIILFCILKAFNLVKVSSLAPLRYLELLFSGLLGYFVFNDTPNIHMLLGTLVIIPTSLYIAIQHFK
ncbi:DMT family transporter [Candidatus Aquarickettsia rohweri]|uniref:S-adenosylmethionine uptake transporter n=1 Tax=Candidatus Aquarickettsia rohweri TaxID=2602574 RepID=A0A429XEQ6_9RICK|nr:DMT family transporter [Candidatus Aquarickettsia rohweri]RST62652.1 DMT family transporter [Candidatus Aquarickettsia rohweri]